MGVAESNDCLNIIDAFSNVCNKLGVSIADKKMYPCAKIDILGLTIDTDELLFIFQLTKNSLLDNLLSRKRKMNFNG